jgi:hypothetical protein
MISLNQIFENITGRGLLGLMRDAAISKNAPRGQRCQHQYLPLKKESTRKKAIIATTIYPKKGKNRPPITIRGKNHIIIYWECFAFMPPPETTFR